MCFFLLFSVCIFMSVLGRLFSHYHQKRFMSNPVKTETSYWFLHFWVHCIVLQSQPGKLFFWIIKLNLKDTLFCILSFSPDLQCFTCSYARKRSCNLKTSKSTPTEAPTEKLPLKRLVCSPAFNYVTL